MTLTPSNKMKATTCRRLLVRVFNDDFSLSFQASGSKVAKIDDLDDVNEHTTESRLEGVTIIAIKDFQNFQVCMFCNGKVDINGDYGNCQKCKTMQKVNNVHTVKWQKLLWKVLVWKL